MNQQIKSSKTLAKATITSVLIASLGLVAFILPAEYNVDPTGIGKQLGLTELAPKEAPAVAEQTLATAAKEDTVTISIAPNSGVEYKFQLTRHQKLTYQWTTDGAVLFFDLHGEPKGDTSGFFESYTIATANEMAGTLTTPFEGSHGWYWKNSHDQPVVVTLKTSGNYEIIGLKK